MYYPFTSALKLQMQNDHHVRVISVLLSSIAIIICTAIPRDNGGISQAQVMEHELIHTQPKEQSVVFSSDIALEDLAKLTEFCVVPNPEVPSSAFIITKGETKGAAGYTAHYQCKETCDDWRQCQVPAYDLDYGELLVHARNPSFPKLALSFVVDGLGGHIAFSADTADYNKTVFVHQGGGGVTYYNEPTVSLEEKSSIRTVMIRWENGYRSVEIDGVNWGWFTRAIEGPSLIPVLNRRIAAVMAWVHENMTGIAPFGTMGCSMGATATFGPVIWYGLDTIIDYQFLGGGPPIGDLNAICGRRSYDRGYCELDGVTQCTTDADCGDNGHCSKPAHITLSHMIEGMINHVHAAEPAICRALSATVDIKPLPQLDASSMLYSGWNWSISHPVDMMGEFGGEPTLEFPLPENWNNNFELTFGGDEHWGLGHFLQIYNKIDAGAGKNWVGIPDTHHCDSMVNGKAADMVVSAMNQL